MAKSGRLALLLLLALVGSGCERVVFDTAPVDSDCDAHLVGHWLSVPDADSQEPEGALRLELSSQCELKLWLREDGQTRPLEPTRLHTGELGRDRLLWLDAGWTHRNFDLDPGPLDDRPGLYVYRYRLRKGELQLDGVAAKVLAPAVLEERIDGELLKRDSDLVVRISGDAANARKALQMRHALRDDSPLRFRREPAAQGSQP